MTGGELADLDCLRPGEGAELLAGHPWRRFVVLGDSVAEGLSEPVPGYPDQPWGDRIAAELRASRPDLAYLNLGCRNLVAADVAAAQLGPALAFDPDLALVAAGGFDVLQPAWDADATEAALRAIVGGLREHGADVLTVGLMDGSFSPYVPERVRGRLRERLHELSRRTAVVGADLGTLHVSLTEHPACQDPGLYSSDGRHGNARSHCISAAEAVRRLGARVSAGRSAAR
jgi:lysophospholipase L1-like esterase